MCCTAEELNIVGATCTSGENEDDPDHPWSPGSLKYYGRAELKTSDHRYQRFFLFFFMKKKCIFKSNV